MKIALRVWNLDADRRQMFVDQIIEIAFKSAWPAAHFLAPNDELKVDCTVPKFLKERISRRVLQCGGMLARCRDKRLTHFVHVAAVRYAHRKAKADSPIGVSPVRYRRINEFLVRYDHGDIVVSHDNSAAGTDLPHLTGDARHFDAIADGDRAFGQDEQPADEITGDVFQTEPNAHTDCARKDCERSNMNAGVFQNNNDPNNEHGIANDLCNRML